jgi:hypothetical protein
MDRKNIFECALDASKPAKRRLLCEYGFDTGFSYSCLLLEESFAPHPFLCLVSVRSLPARHASMPSAPWSPPRLQFSMPTAHTNSPPRSPSAECHGRPVALGAMPLLPSCCWSTSILQEQPTAGNSLGFVRQAWFERFYRVIILARPMYNTLKHLRIVR